MRGLFDKRWVLILSGVALAIVLASMWYSNQLVSELAQKEERLVRFWAQTMEHIFSHPEENAEFLFNNVLVRTDSSMFQVPAILTDSGGTAVFSHTLRTPSGLTGKDSVAYLERELQSMQQENAFRPIKVDLTGGDYQLVWFRESDAVRQLRWFPYLTVLVIIVFLGIVFVNFYLAQRSQMNKVWVGLAKETAHQLGTPLTALMGWTELLKLNAHTPDEVELATELEKDIHQLEVIAERFSKIGSAPVLVPASISASLRKSVDYHQKRAPSKVVFELHDRLPPKSTVRLSPTLFEWVVENLLKNALDAGAKQIEVLAELRGNQILVEVRDNGKGIAPSKLKRVFRPGYTTKKRGWGLGLSLAKRIIEDYHHGRIYVRWSEVNVGTAFRIVLPAT